MSPTVLIERSGELASAVFADQYGCWGFLDLWRDGVTAGETLQQAAARTDAVLDRVRPLLRDGDVAIVGHGHLQRVLAARWLNLEPSAGRVLSHPHTGTLSSLAYEHEEPVISAWNVLP